MQPVAWLRGQNVLKVVDCSNAHSHKLG